MKRVERTALIRPCGKHRVNRLADFDSVDDFGIAQPEIAVAYVKELELAGRHGRGGHVGNPGRNTADQRHGAYTLSPSERRVPGGREAAFQAELDCLPELREGAFYGLGHRSSL